ncbi:MAG: hypothetical protein JG776_403 [Caloramator sp.]|jgi:DNA sulfur modification protein DndE|uniref:DndE family protein n=1 Tax=Caloramator sp. TaxID=1871330 RepID=UPI001DDA5F7C|nr:DndE family protein [Caloramator sp.]MBZ4662721.1 hypothetical protein [Caloramator sp.]
MGFRLVTSKKTEDIFLELGARSNLKPFALAKIAIALSLTNKENIENYPLDQSKGLELNIQTITGKYNAIYKCLLEQHAGRHLTDDEYCPDHLKRHIDRGAEMLIAKYNYATNLERFINLCIKGGNAI